MEANATNGEGGVHTIVFKGFSDELVTLRNSALYANLAMNIFTSTGDSEYLDIANNTLTYIQNEFYDIGATGGYFESVIDGSPIQQSKSLFSHALLLQLLLKLANTGDETARLYLISLWRTISQYFRQGDLFYSTLNRAGDPASSTINTVDNLMMMYSMSSIPLISNLNYTNILEFKDQVQISLDLQIPENIDTDLVLFIENEEEQRIALTGQSGLQELLIDLDPIRPSDESETFDYLIELQTQGVVTDVVEFSITVTLSPGVDLSLGVITVFSIIAVVIFVLFVKRYDVVDGQVTG